MIRRSRTSLLATVFAALAALLVVLLAASPAAVQAADTPTPTEFMNELFEHFARNVTGVSEPVINTDRLLHLYEHLEIVNKTVTVDKWPTDLHDCLTPAQLLQAYEIKESYVNRAGLEKISPGLVAMKASSACTAAHAHGAHEGEKKDEHAEHDHAAHDHADHDEDAHAVSDADKLSSGLVWLYSIVAELIVSGFAVLGITLVPYLSKHRRANQLAMTFLIGLAVGDAARRRDHAP
ncbi:Slc39a10 protein [Allomyces macrogynus ATCC 38327]|uniref:Slc39a10 protein n=1 Tax=Allomyces macrogynus (strain ATCC 38327) TaxID=578462 RepID=A0A0L0S9B0_ALLM3|nr:Slc39a10 protein [Allomyces macrogynus ATCC 38327]|eukprot:KNE58979.1 Slc39a10 protein [Allomyces macrogynus ATCC 38327]